VGRNTAIKRFDPATGKTADMFSAKEGRLSVVVEMLKSPWIARGSDFVHEQDAALGKRRGEPVSVAWNALGRAPAAFEWHARDYPVEQVIQVWAIELYWWDLRRRVSRRCWRVLARGGTYDLAYDRLERRWLLLSEQD
jgi:hypothetical protein